MLKNKIIKANVLYLPAQIIALIMSLAKGLILPKLLMPDEFGLITIIFLIITYSKIANLGILNAFDMEYPKMLQNSEYFSNKENYRDSCFTFFSIHNAIYCLGAIIFFFIYYADKPSILIVLILIAIGMFFDNINEFVVGINRAHKNFYHVSINRVSGYILSGCLIIIATYKYGIYGAIASIFISNIIMLYFYFKGEDKPHFTSNLTLMKPIYLLGISLFIILFLSTLIDTIDRIVVVKIYGLYQSGIYNLSHSLSRIIMLFFSSATYVLYPFVLSEYAKNYDLQSLLNYYKKYGLFFFWISPIFLAALFIFFSSFIPWYLPAYGSALNFIHFIFLGIFWIVFSMLNDTFLLVIKKQSAVIRNQIVIIIQAIILFAYAYINSLDVYYIALIFFIYSMVYGLLSFYSILYYLKVSFKSTSLLLAKYLVTFFIFAMLSFLLVTNNKEHLIEFGGNGLLALIVNMLIIVIFSIPFIWYMNKRLSIFNEIYSIVFSKLEIISKH